MQGYTLESKLGEGAFAVVYKARRHEDGKSYAMKKIRIAKLSEKEVGNCLNEVRILASIESPNILSYRDSFYDYLTSTFCLVTELLEGGDLQGLICKHRQMRLPLNENTIWRVAVHGLRALAALHSLRVLHRDVKSANIFLTKEGVAKLGDMNVSIVSPSGLARTQTGTPYYASPEVWQDRPYDSKCDIWSLGCVLYEMAALHPPFRSHDLRSLKKTVLTGIYKRIPSQYSDHLYHFIRLCLCVDSKNRPSANDLLENAHLKEHTTNETELKYSMTSSKLLYKIRPPRRREFRLIKDQLPQNRFRIRENCTQKISDEDNKENISSKANKDSAYFPLPERRDLPYITKPVSQQRPLLIKDKINNERISLPKKLPRA